MATAGNAEASASALDGLASVYGAMKEDPTLEEDVAIAQAIQRSRAEYEAQRAS